MAFTTQIFIFVFFPLCFILYYLIMFIQQTEGALSRIFQKYRTMDLILAGISCCFYAWACFDGLPKVQTVYQTVIQIKLGYLIQQIIFVIFFMIAIMFMVNSHYSPFLYFQY